ncbi:MAG: cytochrome C oxidase subunit IV family protein [Saprospiraceae bacterium]|nr:cytochrome C oxidase subunit IV family protein [Saprospiraceae bacterium]MBK8449645.1 cytochrome C oxidase subunit IV family protein [Saprospiraceae bacterium]MBK8484297.1 cytochrome C oxidase subunit IV family protein [Saprospiraceae bacterium]MBK9728392.1 cytochrome C oxidase subunit IV family protein [Saprospiraceae bacterium]
MAHLSYEEGKKVVFKGFVLLGIVTILEVMVALVGKGYIIHGFHLPRSIMYLLMISMSIYKAYYIIFEFMHMRYEVPGLMRSVLMPTMLLIWAIIAFFTEGNTWYHWRKQVNDRPIAQFSMPSSHHNKETIHSNTTDTTQHDNILNVKHNTEAVDSNAHKAH